MTENPVVQSDPMDKGLRTGSIGLLGNVTIGLSATAPTYSSRRDARLCRLRGAREGVGDVPHRLSADVAGGLRL